MNLYHKKCYGRAYGATLRPCLLPSRSFTSKYAYAYTMTQHNTGVFAVSKEEKLLRMIGLLRSAHIPWRRSVSYLHLPQQVDSYAALLRLFHYIKD